MIMIKSGFMQSRESEAGPIRQEIRANLSAYRHVLDHLGRDIVSGTVQAGQTLPNADELAERFDVSRTVLREVTRVLSSKGMVRPRQGVGAIVLPRSNWMLLDEDVLTWVAEIGPDARFLDELRVVRRMIEPPAAALAAENATDEEIAALELAHEGMMRSRDDADEHVVFDIQFHRSVMAATHNEILTNMTNAIILAMRVRHAAALRFAKSDGGRFDEHGAILDAIKAHSPDAAAAAMLTLIEANTEDDRMLQARRKADAKAKERATKSRKAATTR